MLRILFCIFLVLLRTKIIKFYLFFLQIEDKSGENHTWFLIQFLPPLYLGCLEFEEYTPSEFRKLSEDDHYMEIEKKGSKCDSGVGMCQKIRQKTLRFLTQFQIKDFCPTYLFAIIVFCFLTKIANWDFSSPGPTLHFKLFHLFLLKIKIVYFS